jgi:hypothetical protein
MIAPLQRGHSMMVDMRATPPRAPAQAWRFPRGARSLALSPSRDARDKIRHLSNIKQLDV